MTEDSRDPSRPAERDDTITVEAEYTRDGCEKPTIGRWTFEGVSPHEAKDRVVSDCVPLAATLWRVGLWHGSVEGRPDGGHETGILQEDD